MKKAGMKTVMAGALALLLAVMFGCGGGGGGGGGGVDYFQAVGVYTYTPDVAPPPAGLLDYTITRSSFPDDCGPQDGDIMLDVEVATLTATAITILDLPDPELGDVDFTGTRSTGDPNSVVGTWKGTIAGDNYTIIFQADGGLIIRTAFASCRD